MSMKRVLRERVPDEVRDRTEKLLGVVILTPEEWDKAFLDDIGRTGRYSISHTGRPTFIYQGKPILIRPRDLPIPS